MLAHSRSFTTAPRRFETLVDRYALVLSEAAGALAGAAAASPRGTPGAAIEQIKSRADALSAALRAQGDRNAAGAGEWAAIVALLDGLDGVTAEISETVQALESETFAAGSLLAALAPAAVDALDGVAGALPFLRSPARYRAELLTAAGGVLTLTGRAAALVPGNVAAADGASPPIDLAVRSDLPARLASLCDRLADTARAIARLAG